MTLSVNQWTAIGAVAAVLGIAGGIFAWAWKYIVAFFSLFGHARRIAQLAQEVDALKGTSATKADVEGLHRTMQALHDGHAETDRLAFEKVSNETAAIKDKMARQTDLQRIESKVDQLLLDGFNRGANRS